MRDIHWLREAEDEFADIVNYVMQQFGQGVAMRVYDDSSLASTYWQSFPI